MIDRKIRDRFEKEDTLNDDGLRARALTMSANAASTSSALPPIAMAPMSMPLTRPAS